MLIKSIINICAKVPYLWDWAHSLESYIGHTWQEYQPWSVFCTGWRTKRHSSVPGTCWTWNLSCIFVCDATNCIRTVMVATHSTKKWELNDGWLTRNHFLKSSLWPKQENANGDFLLRSFYRIFFIETPPWSDAKCCRQMSWQLIWRKVSASTRPVCEFYLVINASPIVNSDFRKVSKAYRKMGATKGVLIAMITILWCLLFNKLHHGEIVKLSDITSWATKVI